MTGIAIAALFLAAVGCEQSTGGSEVGGDWTDRTDETPPAAESVSITYRGATDGGETVELIITGDAGASADAAYTPQDGDSYVIIVGGTEVSRGSIAAADGDWEFYPDDGSDMFTAADGEDGMTLAGAITDGLDGEALHILAADEPPDNGAAEFRIILSETGILVFPSQEEGYEEPEGIAVEIFNTGDEDTEELTVALSGTDEGAFFVDTETIDIIYAGDSAEFTVAPLVGLEEGTYNARITVGGENVSQKSFGIRFTVKPVTEPEPEPEPPSYTVDFDLNCDDAAGQPDSLSVTQDGTAAKPEDDPTREGFSFGGWFADDEAAEPFDFDRTPITGDIILYAKWLFSSAEKAAEYMTADEGGTTINDPVKLVMNMDLAGSAWGEFMNAMNGTGKYFDLDLSESSVEGMTDVPGEFDAAKNMGKMTGIVLPNDATSIKTKSFQGVYKAAHYLLKASGANVEVIGDNAFDLCTSLAEVDFPKAVSIGAGAFWECYPLKEADFPLVETIGNNGFNSTGLVTASFPELRKTGYSVFARTPTLANLYAPKLEITGRHLFNESGTTTLIITMGANPPDVGAYAFDLDSTAKPRPLKTVIVRVPVAARDNYTDEWVDEFKLKGSDHYAVDGWYLYDPWHIMENVTVVIETY
jgi:uncharacterized repeat protein (TIGR02543 family)